MHICYLYVYDHIVLKNTGLTFDDRYVFRTGNGVLQISKNDKALPKNFWGLGIYSLTAIVGNNGSGKTTALRLMKRLFVEGEPRNEDVDVAIVYEQCGALYVYNPQHLRINCETGIKCTEIHERLRIETLYYSGHFQPYIGAEGELELSGSYDASDSWLLIKDLLDYSNVDTYHLTEPIYNHLSAYYAQNNYRICEILLLEGFDKLITHFEFPQYVLLYPNKGGWNTIKLEKLGRYKNLNIPNMKCSSTTPRDWGLEHFIFYNIINLIAEGKGRPEIMADLLRIWLDTSKEGNVVDVFVNWIEDANIVGDEKNSLASVAYVIGKMDDLCDFDADSGTFFIDIKKNAEQLRTLVKDVLRTRYFLTARFFDIYYGHSLSYPQRLSSGELEMLNFLSRLYYGITLMPQKIDNKESPRLLLVDEAEIGFHPDWQRQYVKILTEFMGYMMVKAGADFQIVITSHSPIILSDMPVNCVNFLLKEGNETHLATDEKQTFCENVFNLYRRAFFMKDGLIGTFARKKLDDIRKAIAEGRVTEETRRLIELIGDERIKNYFLRQLSKTDIDAQIRYHEARLCELKKERRDE